MWRIRLIQRRPDMLFKTCRLLSGNVRNRELTIIQRRILRRLRNKKRSIKRKIYPRKNKNSYIQSQTTRKLPLLMLEFLIEALPILISLLAIYFGVPLICFCDDQWQTSSDGEPGAGIGAQSSIGAQPPGEGAPNMGGHSRDSGWTSFDLGVLAEPYSETETGETSVNQGVARPVPPANPVASGEAGPSHLVPLPYDEDEVIGGDSLLAIQRRLLGKYEFPSSEEIQRARIKAEDLFEVKVDIIRRMTSLDPEGDWLRQGARALDNPRTATGEESLERLYQLRDDIAQGGMRSQSFADLKNKVFLRRQNLDAESQA